MKNIETFRKESISLFSQDRTDSKAAKRPRVKCAKCGYKIVMLRKYLHLGPPICPKYMEWMKAGVGNLLALILILKNYGRVERL